MQYNPFSPEVEPDRHAIWEMLVARDIAAYVAADWSKVADDFIEDGFFGVDARRSHDPDQWEPKYPSLEKYREEWLRQASADVPVDAKRLKAEIHALTDLTHIDVEGDCAVAHKKFDGTVTSSDGSIEHLQWQTLYTCRKVNGTWKIAGFLGYMPYPHGGQSRGRAKVTIESRQHKTAGPYSPVLRISSDSEIVVISGQAPVDLAGEVVGSTIEEQSRVTLENCRTQLKAARLELDDVFKVNVYLTDLENWPRFNAVYREIMPEPFPVRTAIGCELLPGFLVEIELWAASRR